MEAIYKDCELEFDEIQVPKSQLPEQQQQQNALEILQQSNYNQVPIAQRIQEKYSNCNKFYCPYSENHVLTTYQKLFNHIFTCKPLAGKTLYICKYMAQSPYSYAHIFLSRDERNQHEEICEFQDYSKRNEEGPELKIPDSFRGKKQSNARDSCWLNIHDDPTKNIVNADQLIQISKRQEQQKLKQEQLIKQQQQLESEVKELEIQLQAQKQNSEKIQTQYQKEEDELKIEIENKKKKKSEKDEALHFYETQYKENNQIDLLKSQYNEKLNRQIQLTKDELNRKFNEMKRELDQNSYSSQLQLQEIEQQFKDCTNQNNQYKTKIDQLKLLQKNLKEDLDSLTQKLNALKMSNATLKHDQTTLSLTSTYIQPTTGINTDLMCIICAKRPRVMINLPCKHISHCAVCQKTSLAGKHKICWICGGHVRKTIPRKLIEMALPTK